MSAGAGATIGSVLVAKSYARFAPREPQNEVASGAKTKEADALLDRPYFTLKDIERLLLAAKREGADREQARFTFGQRFDLSSNPWDLSMTVPIAQV